MEEPTGGTGSEAAPGTGTPGVVDIIGTIKQAFRICYEHPKEFIGMAAVVYLPGLALGLLQMANEERWWENMNTVDPQRGLIGLFALILGIAGFILFIYFVGSVTLLTAYALDKRPLGWTDAFAWVRDRDLFWGIFLVLLLTGLAVFGGLLLLIIPGIIFGTWFALSPQVRILSDIRGRKALKESRRIVKPIFWETLLLIAIIFIPIAIPMWIAQGTFAALFGFFSISPARIIAPTLISYIVGVLWGPVVIVGVTLLYINRVGGLEALRKDLFL